MNVILTKHAKKRIAQREITEEEIKLVISDPDNVKEVFKERMAVRRRITRGTLEVIYKESQGAFIIITSYWIKEK